MDFFSVMEGFSEEVSLSWRSKQRDFHEELSCWTKGRGKQEGANEIQQGRWKTGKEDGGWEGMKQGRQ